MITILQYFHNKQTLGRLRENMPRCFMANYLKLQFGDLSGKQDLE